MLTAWAENLPILRDYPIMLIGTVLIVLASFALGGGQPLLYAGLLALLRRGRSSLPRRLSIFTALVAMFISLGACSAVLIYFASLGHAPGFAIALPFILGVGVARLALREI